MIIFIFCVSRKKKNNHFLLNTKYRSIFNTELFVRLYALLPDVSVRGLRVCNQVLLTTCVAVSKKVRFGETDDPAVSR
jgi:hypothetical protein